jgi:nucleoid DNA-binding protein
MAAAKSAKKAATKKQAPAKNIPAAKTAMTKSAILEEIAGKTGLSKKQVSSVFDELTVLIERHIKKGAVGQFALPGLMKIEVKRKPATKAGRESIRLPARKPCSRPGRPEMSSRSGR